MLTPPTPLRKRELKECSSEPKELDLNRKRIRQGGAEAKETKQTAEQGSAWFQANLDNIFKAEALIGAQLADKKRFGAPSSTALCDEVFAVMRKSLRRGEGAREGDGSSVLLLGEGGSGKTHVVEWCVSRLCEVQPSLVVLRAQGGAYSTDWECIRHLAAQVANQLVTVPHTNASFEEGMEWIRTVLRESFKHASAVVIVLDKFEHFCSKARQTLLYNLFDIAQESGVCLSIVATSEKMDVMGSLEKRIRSRFSMHHLFAFRPTEMEDLVPVLLAKLRLPTSCGLPADFVAAFHERLETALRARAPAWNEHLQLGRPPSWFLWRCLPLAALLREACTDGLSGGAPAVALRGPGVLATSSEGEKRALLLSGLSEADHIVLIALCRLHDREEARTLSKVLHEIQLLHEGGGLVADFRPERYCAAFDRLYQKRLVEFHTQGVGDLPRRYLPCWSTVDSDYAHLIDELGRAGSTRGSNLLCALPIQVQRWATRQRRKE